MSYKQQILIYFSIVGLTVLGGFIILVVYILGSSSNNLNTTSNAKTIKNNFEYSLLLENVNIAQFGTDDLSLDSLGFAEESPSVDPNTLSDIESTLSQTIKNMDTIGFDSFPTSDLENF